jgi:hypothetical protein
LFVADQGNYRIRLVLLPANDGSLAEVSTLAGSGQLGQKDGAPLQATFAALFAVCVDPKSLRLYIADLYAVRVLTLSTESLSATKVETLAGSAQNGFADGSGSNARFGLIRGLAMELDGSVLYVADGQNGRIRAVQVSSGEASTFAGSKIGSTDGIRLIGLAPPASAGSRIPTTKCSGPVVLAATEGWFSDGPGSYDSKQSCQWLMRALPKQVVTVQFASFETERGFDTLTVFDAAGRELAVLSGSLYQGATVTAVGGMDVRFEADMTMQAAGFVAKYSIGFVRPIGAEAMQIGDLAAARLQPFGLTRLARNLYFTEAETSQLRFVDMDTGYISTLVRAEYGPGARDGPINSTSAYVSLREPAGLTGSSSGSLYIADSSNRLIRELKLAPSLLSPANATSMVWSFGSSHDTEVAEASYGRSSETMEASTERIGLKSDGDSVLGHWQWILGGICGVVAVTVALAFLAVYRAGAKKRIQVQTTDVGSQRAPKPSYMKTCGLSTVHPAR